MKKLIGHIYEEDGKEIIERFPRKKSLWIELDTMNRKDLKFLECPNCGKKIIDKKEADVITRSGATYCGYCGHKNIVEEEECKTPF